MSKFAVEYKGVTCIDVDWSHDVFTMQYEYYTFRYKPQKYEYHGADETTVLGVIKQFIDEMSKHALDHFCEALKTIGEKSGRISDEMYGKKGESAAYLRGYAEGLSYAYKWIPYIEAIPDPEDDDQSWDDEQLTLF